MDINKTSIRSQRLSDPQRKNIVNKLAIKPLKVIFNNEDVTPKLLGNRSAFFVKDKFFRLKSKHDLNQFNQFSNLMTSQMFQSIIQTEAAQSQRSQASSMKSFQSIIKEDDALEEQLNDLSSLSLFSTAKASTSEVYEGNENLEEKSTMQPGSTIKIKLLETPVKYLFEWRSETADKETAEGEIVEKDNSLYEYLTEGKGRNRKTTNVQIQTQSKIMKTRSTDLARVKCMSKSVFASEWDMYDTFDVQNKFSCTFKEDDAKKGEKNDHCDQMEKLLKNPKFQESIMIMERILAHYKYAEQQKHFRNLIDNDPFRPKIQYKYSLELLWAFENANTIGYSVTTMQWNPKNNDILAVGYGKFYYSDQKTGILNIWNIKNPKQAEREYYFSESVSALAFCNLEPNLLAVGFYDGSLKVLDISFKKLKVLYSTNKLTTSFRDPIWKIIWMSPDELHPNEEHLVCCCQDGQVSRFRCAKINELSNVPLMTVSINEMQIKGIERIKYCSASFTPVKKNASATILTKHPVDSDVYYIGTGDGSIHVCSRNFLHQHMHVFIAHTGPVYAIDFSSYCNKLFLTCGADANVTLWVDGFDEPIDTLSITSLEYIQGAMWCPKHSTILASIAGAKIYLWDILRKTYQPTSIHETPDKERLTTLLFTPTGNSLAVGDVSGKVHIYSLQNMPFPHFYPKEMLTQILNKILVTRQDLKVKIQASGGFNRKKDEKINF